MATQIDVNVQFSKTTAVVMVHLTHSRTQEYGMLTTFPQCKFLHWISRNTQSKSYMVSLTECVRDFQNNALWDTH